MKKWWSIGLGLLAAVSLVGEFAGGHGAHSSHWWTGIPGFFIYFGFFGCILLILFAKNLGRMLLTRDEDYYDK
jgi:hypothetical protein